MKKLFTLLLLVPTFLVAQTTHNVAVFGGGSGNPAPSYQPQNLTIDVGDEVVWTNTQGSHNVYGELDVFPNNPEGFSSGTPQGAPWTFSYTFTVPGTYGYHCTQGNHAQTQFGTITVTNPNSVEELASEFAISLFPNPAQDHLWVTLGEQVAAGMQLLDLNGKVVKDLATVERTGVVTLSVGDIPAGTYFVSVVFANGFTLRKLVVLTQ